MAHRRHGSAVSVASGATWAATGTIGGTLALTGILAPGTAALNRLMSPTTHGTARPVRMQIPSGNSIWVASNTGRQLDDHRRLRRRHQRGIGLPLRLHGIQRSIGARLTSWWTCCISPTSQTGTDFTATTLELVPDGHRNLHLQPAVPRPSPPFPSPPARWPGCSSPPAASAAEGM